MDHIKLPISKSIANRILLLQAIHGDPLMRVSADMPDDVLVLHDALEQLREYKKGEPLTLYLKNNGTALRFLQVHIEKCYPGAPITLTGDPRLMERDGKPTTQTTSALILHGEPIPVSENESPYITMSRRIRESYSELCERSYSETVLQQSGLTGASGLLEADWSAASYWYEYIAIHGGELLLEGLKEDSLQGDRVVADIYAKSFGVQTTFTPEGAILQSEGRSYSPKDSLTAKRSCNEVVIDFVNIPDLYPAIALTCECLGITLHASGTDRLRFKESDRLEAVRLHEVRNDHRMAMALMAADFPVSKEEQKCVAKSYPDFVQQWQNVHGTWSPCTLTHITPRRGINDDNLGKKHALSKLIHAATTEYVWLHDDDVIWPPAALNSQFTSSESPLSLGEGRGEAPDLIILPLRMEPILNSQFSILNSLQIAEYAAIQELTMRTAKRGKAVMCSGANLIVRRKAWLECEPDLHPEIPSGDDMFLLEAMKKRGMQIAIIDEPDYTAVVRPVTTWRAFFRQRMRWAGKAPRYTDRDIIRCGALVATANILQILCPLILLVKFPIEYSLIRTRQKREHTRTDFFIALLLEVLYPFYMLVCLLGGLIRRKEW